MLNDQELMKELRDAWEMVHDRIHHGGRGNVTVEEWLRLSCAIRNVLDGNKDA